ncbi:hypothetical protein HD554DRAFT_2100326 [Boletus coccyginus]|nr:hypothetical protein HD554DRAFT_2100326 [Boletus coccyginus]
MQRPAEGFPSSTPNSELEAMKSAHSAAVNSNERIFPIFAKKLSSKDTKEFVNTAHKLAVWLGSEKAYYPAARPKIVELLEIAISAFVATFAHHSAVAEPAERLRQLVQVVIPFIRLFPEIELQSRLERVIADAESALPRVSTSATHGNVLPRGSVTANISSPTLASPVHPQLALIPGPQKPVSQIQPSSIPGAVKAIPGSVHVDAPRPPNPSEVASDQIDANSSLASPIMNSPHDLRGNISSIPSKPQPKRARKAELSDELVARDLDWFKSNQAPPIVNEDHGAASSKAGESSPALASDTAHILGPSLSPKRKTARMVPSRRLPRRIPLDVAQEMKSGVYTSTLPPGFESAGEEGRSFEIVHDVSVQKKPSSERMGSDARSAAIPETHDMLEVLPHKELPSLESQPLAPSSKPSIPQTDHQSPSVKVPLLNGESVISVGSGSERLLEFPPKPESTPPQSPRVLQLRGPILPPLMSTWEPPLNLNFRISPTPPGQPQQSGVDANERRFDNKMTVIHSTPGKPFTHTHMFDISLNESISAKISKWVNRKFHPSEAPHGVCISLGCYRLPDFFDSIKLGSGRRDIEELTSRSSCSWPYPDLLSLHVNNGMRQTVIALSPPLFLTPDQCVDISSLMKPGNNTLEIRQQGDLSEYLVVLHAHNPTRGQLAELDVVKTVDERWKQFLDALSARAAPGKIRSTPPAGVVGVF